MADEQKELEGIAIVGMAGRFPGADNIETFWHNLVEGVESIVFFSRDESRAAGVPETYLNQPNWVPAGALLRDIDRFDAEFFGYTALEAELMDPQHRLFLECCQHALDDAAVDPRTFNGSIGVFGGMSLNTYLLNNVSTNREVMRNAGLFQTTVGNDKDFLTTRVSYKLGLKGPSVDVQTACSSALVAVNLAVNCLLNYQGDLFLAGGVSIMVPHRGGYLYQEGGVMSPDGHCRAFDAQARGTLRGNGVGVVALRRLEDAWENRDPIYAVIKGAAMNNDGGDKVGFTAPSVDGQAAVIAEALELAGVDAETVTYIEAHGTATEVGDPIEVAALTQVYSELTDRRGYCAIGSLKTNIGHLDAAAGVAGLIKVALALKHGVIPPSLNFKSPNPAIDFAESPFFVNTKARAWSDEDGPRRAGLSSFGIGGTNAHLILEQAPTRDFEAVEARDEVFLLSARNEAVLDNMGRVLGDFISRHPEVELRDVAFTLQVGRGRYEHRRALVGTTRAEVIDDLRKQQGYTAHSRERDRAIVFGFPGQGAQYLNMGAELYESEPVFRDAIDRCAKLLTKPLGLDLREVLFGNPAEQERSLRLRQTQYTQPALFTISYALTQLLAAYGIKPKAMIGHSIGEYVAATLAGVFSLEHALIAVSTRGRLMADLPEGQMMAVSASEDQVRKLLDPNSGVDIAAVNTEMRTVVAGSVEAIATFEAKLTANGLMGKRLHTSHAYHSAMMAPACEPLVAALGRLSLKPPKTPFVSCLTGTWITDAQATDPRYWARQMRESVKFSAGLAALDQNHLLLDVGPNATLCSFARGRMTAFPVLPKRDDASPSSTFFREMLGKLWVQGVAVDWRAYHEHSECPPRRISLPGYAFADKRYWITPGQPPEPKADAAPTAASAAAPVAQPAAPAAATPVSSPPAKPRRERLLTELVQMLARLVGQPEDSLGEHVTFMDLDLDSLILMQVSQSVQDRFGVPISFRNLMGDLNTPANLASYLDNQLAPEAAPPEPVAVPRAQVELGTAAATPAVSDGDGSLAQIMNQQLQAMNQLIANQLAVLNGGGLSDFRPQSAPPVAAGPLPAPAHAPAARPVRGTKVKEDTFVAFQPLQIRAGQKYTPEQEAYIQAFIVRFNQRTRNSKECAQKYRKPFADNRNAAGFRLPIKELVYPIVAKRSKGAHIWDIDDNRYLDLTMGFGVNYFGHSPAFIDEAIRAQLDEGMHLGPQSELSGEVAELVCELTGLERVAFCNSGTEAVMVALRLARTVTGRTSFAMFAGSYHGTFDGILARADSGGGDPVPLAPGISPNHIADAVVLEYGTEESLEVIRQNAGQWAAILIETVQSRRPDFQPKAFIQEVRKITERTGTALIFDEIITGFRLHPAGAQAFYDTRADLVTYGKVVGGGMPLGLVAGSSRFLDPIDGGDWRFGDDSFPSAEQTFFAGTFCKHPLTLAAAKAVLLRLKAEGAALQDGLNQRVTRLVNDLNGDFDRWGLPIVLVRCASLFRFTYPRDLTRTMDLFFYKLLEKGIYIWEGRNCFLSLAHTDQDLAHFRSTIAEVVAELRAAGFFDEQPPSPSGGGGPANDDPLRLPLTHQQQEVWLGTRTSLEAGVAFNETVLLRLGGALDENALEGALEQLVQRHQALRARFESGGEFQMVMPMVNVNLTRMNLTREEDVVQALAQHVREKQKAPLDLENGPAWRFVLYRLGSGRFALQIVLHHIVADGWSTAILVSELLALYRARTAKGEPLPPAPAFADFVARAGSSMAADEAFWRASFATLPAVAVLPTDRPRPAFKTYSGAKVGLALDAALSQQLKQASKRHGCTLFLTTLAAYHLLHHKLTGNRDAVIGIPVAGQTLTGFERLVGHCVNLLPIRSCMVSDQSFDTYLKTLKAIWMDAMEHQYFAFGSLVKLLDPPRDPSRTPLLDCTFNMERVGEGRPDLPGLSVEVTTNPDPGAKFDLSLDVFEVGGALRAELVYNTDLFDAETVTRWLQHYTHILEQIASGSEAPVARWSLCDEKARKRLLAWALSPSEFPQQTTLHRAFEARAAECPTHIAVSDGSSQLTYAELECQANQLAHLLLAQGVGREQPVAICLPRSTALPLALLAVLKSGGTYVPLDPSYPIDQRALRLQQSGARILLTLSALNWPGDHQAINLDGAPAASFSQTAPALACDSQQLAYIIFTSGSTGVPKGVAVRHEGVVNLVHWHNQRYAVRASDRVAIFAGPAFDASVWEHWPHLIAGCTLVIPDDEVRGTPRLLPDWLADQRIDLCFMPTPLAEAVLAEPWPEATTLRALLTGGDKLQNRPSQLAFALHNHYGPTEDSVVSTCCAVPPGDREIPPIGRGIANKELYVVDAHFNLVPQGVSGQLLVGGVGLARGYWRQPGKTAEVFVPNPFGPAGSRLYLTGDLVSHRGDGQLNFIGRRDNQVQIRGFRVELGEIESALNRCEGVADALVLLGPDGSRLIAYLRLAAAGQAPDAALLRDRLKSQLPDYMVPSAFVFLDQWPLTPNGKIDRRRLPEPVIEADADAGAENPLEQMVADIFAEILKRDQVPRNQNFFDIGGHSLLATRVMARIKDVCGVNLQLRELFAAPTVTKLAAVLSHHMASEAGIQVPDLVPMGQTRPPLSYAQQRLWFLDKLGSNVAYNIPVVLRLRGDLDTQALARAIAEVSLRQESLRTVFESDGSEPVQRILEAPVALSSEDLRRAGEDVASLALTRVNAFCQQRFDLAQGPLFAACLFQLEDDHYILAMCMHHIIADGWSVNILFNELDACYRKARGAAAPALPALPVQYRDYATWQRGWLQGEALDAMLSYWRDRLGKAPEPLLLPADFSRPPVQTFNGEMFIFALDPQLSKDIGALGRRHGATLFMTLLGLFQLLMHRTTGAPTVLVGSPVAGRDNDKVKDLIGFFVNTLVFRADFPAGQGFETFLREIRKGALEAFAHQDVPFEQMVEVLEPERNLNTTPVFQVMFALQNVVRNRTEFGGLEARFVDPGLKIAKFDITLIMEEYEQCLAGSWEYNTDLFSRERIERLHACFVTLLEAVVAEPTRSLTALEILPAAERRTLLEAFNQPTGDLGDLRCLHDHVAGFAVSHPQALALLGADRGYTYAELDRAADDLAGLLKQRGAGSHSLVGICLPRTVERIVTAIAVLKLGAAFVPLDPAYPAERLAFMIEDAQLSLIVTRSESRAALPSTQTQIFDLAALGAGACAPFAPVRVPLDAIAYVIYTSGSTGKPKGVLVPHRGLANLVVDQRDHVAVHPGDRVLQFASFSFDASLLEMTMALGNGGALCVAPNEQLLPGPELHRCLLDLKITHLFLSPSSLAALPDEPLPDLRFLSVGAEACSEDLVRRFGSDRKMYNLYGPTEATIYASQDHCLPGQGVPSIGKPLRNVQCHILDRSGNLLPLGIPGELCVGGVGVTRGYHKRPALTAEKFIPNPYGAPGSRLYRTGDLARFGANGKLDFLGRIDLQVKIRGQRVELGEVEAALRRHPGVRDALVTVGQPGGSGAFLAAYVIPANQDVSPAALKAFLARDLPPYMVPAAFVMLERFPQTANGKLDRKALPDPQGGTAAAAAHHGATGPIVEMVAEVFAEVLGLSQVAPDGGFFELGGHSLLAARLVSRLSTLFQREVPVSAVFSQPTVEAMARYLESGDPDRPVLPPIVPGSGAELERLSFAQQRLWFVQLMQPTAAYNIPLVFALEGPLESERLASALACIVARHEPLRTSYRETSEGPRQFLKPADEWSLARVDLSAHEDPELALQELIRREADHIFDLAQWLFRATLVRCHDQRHVLLLNCHHINSDGWSTRLLFRELEWLYQTDADQGALEPLPFQYRDFARWQRDVFTPERQASERQWWREYLGRDPKPLDLPKDFPRPAVQTFNGARYVFTVDSATADPFKALGQRLGATQFMAQLAAFQVLLYRYTGEETLLLGSPIAGRHHPGCGELIGFFVNTLVLRGDLAPQQSFSEYLRVVRGQTLKAFSHQDLPFEELVEALEVRRDPSTSPVFQVMFTLQNVVSEPLRIGDLLCQPLSSGFHAAKYDLTLTLSQTETGLVGGIEYNTDLFLPNRIQALARHYVQLMTAIVADPETHLASLALMDASERRLLLERFAGGTQPFPENQTIHGAFAAQVAAHGGAPALDFMGKTMSYAELDRCANQVAHLLREKGVGEDQLVGVCLRRSFDLVIALLGVLKAGGAYVPLDPAYPSERLAYMCDDCALSLILCHDELTSALPEGPERLSMTQAVQARYSDAPLAVAGDALDRAYINYTSGSTGQPKGVQTTHQNVLRLVSDRDYVHCAAGDAVAHVANTSFDATTFELWTPLLAGGRVCMLDKDLLFDPERTERWFVERQIRHLFMTTALVNQIASANPGAFRHLDTLLFGGERVDVSAVRKLRAAGPPKRLLHVYGPTETTTFATWYQVGELDARANNLAIGRPLHNTTLYILDRFGRPVPVGIPGELFIGGAGLARGYHRRPALTADRFTPDAFGHAAAGRLYRTGDLCCFLESGDVLYLSRIDRQVKLRGFRIELGEIENRLRQHPAVQQAHVDLHRFPQGDQRLVAYLGIGDANLDIASLRGFLAAQMPDFMIPSHFLLLEALPVTPNGKLDTRALPQPEDQAADPRRNAEPTTLMEGVLQQLWKELLGVDVGIHDNFFEVGGHSLLAARLVGRLREALNRELPVRAIFDHPTIAQLATCLDHAATGLSAPIEPRPTDERVPLSFAQQRMWFLHTMEPSAVYNMPFFMRLSGQLDRRALAGALTALVNRHESLRTIFPSGGQSAYQQILPASQFALQVLDLGELEETAREARLQELCRLEAGHMFHLEQGPLFHARLVMLSAEEHFLILNLHHIVADGWSMNVMFGELERSYNALRAGGELLLPAPARQYGDFCVWQRQWLSGEVLEQMLAFWRDQLGVDPEPLDLPLDFQRPSMQTFNGDLYTFAIDSDTATRLRQVARDHLATPYMILAATLQILLHRYTSAPRVLIGTPVAARNRAETHDMIGLFANTLVLRGQTSGDPTLAEYLQRMRKDTLDAFSNQDLPFEQLVNALQTERNLSTSPLFQVFFSLQNMVSGEISLDGLQARMVTPDTRVAKFDLSLMVQETDDSYLAVWEYNTDLFKRSTMAVMANHFLRLLQACPEHQRTALSQLPLLTEAERQTLIVTWNESQLELATQNVAERLAAAAASHASEIALFQGERSWTYAQLDEEANRWAHLLRGRGLGLEQPVALCFPRVGELVLAMMACLKAGAAYVPLDPAYPEERMRIAVEDSRAQVLLTQTALIPTLTGLAVEKICFDRHQDELGALSAAPPPARPGGLALAYVLFTSGSTGRPKGVAISHGAVCAMLQWARLTYAPHEIARLMACTSVCFDLSVYEIFFPLTMGGAVDLVDSPLALINEARPVTMINTVPSAMAALLAQEAVPSTVCTVNLAGEALPRELVDRIYALGHVTAVYNLYGPSEDTTYSTYEKVPAQATGAPMIGRPLQGTQAYMLDRRGQLLPARIAGELCLAGAGLARGYLGRPGLTAERFVPNPFSELPGDRLYRTGDLVRYEREPEGLPRLEYLGRIDRQVKLRGFRIELAEIENLLDRHRDVARGVVMVRQEPSPRLVAYVAAVANAKLTASELTAYLAERLPEYMVPADIVMLDQLPLTPNGKVDFRALPAPEVQATSGNRTLHIPANHVELILLGIWEELLDTRPISVLADFFKLGGHSILAVRLMSDIRHKLGVDLAISNLFKHPTIRKLAAHILSSEKEAHRSLVPVQPLGSKRPLFCVHPVGGNSLCYFELAMQLGFDQPVYGLESIGVHGDREPLERVPEMAAHYISEMRSVQPHGPYQILGWSFGGLVCFEMGRQLRDVGEEVSLLVILDSHAKVVGKHAPDIRKEQARFLYVFGHEQARMSKVNLEISLDHLLSLDPVEQEAYYLSCAQAAGMYTSETAAESLKRVLRVSRGNTLSMKYYKPEGYPVRVTLFKPIDVVEEELQIAREIYGMELNHPANAWDELPEVQVDLFKVPGDHATMGVSPNVEHLARILQQQMVAEPNLNRHLPEIRPDDWQQT